MGEKKWNGINGVRPKDPNDALEFPLKERIKSFLTEYSEAKTEAEKNTAKEKFSKDIRDCKSKTSVLVALEEVFRRKIEGYQFICEELHSLLLENVTLPQEDFSKEYEIQDDDSMVQRIKELGEEELNKGPNVEYLDEHGRLVDKKTMK